MSEGAIGDRQWRERSMIAFWTGNPEDRRGSYARPKHNVSIIIISSNISAVARKLRRPKLQIPFCTSAFAHRRRGAPIGTIGATRDNRGAPPRARARSAHSRRMRYRPPRQHQRQHQHHRRRTLRPGTEDGHPSRRTCLDGSDDRGVVIEKAVANGCGGDIVTSALTQGT